MTTKKITAESLLADAKETRLAQRKKTLIEAINSRKESIESLKRDLAMSAMEAEANIANYEKQNEMTAKELAEELNS